MDGSDFDVLTQRWVTRRNALGQLAGGLGGAVGLFGVAEIEARKKGKRKGKGNRNRNRNKQPEVSPPPISPPAPPPAPLAPVAHLDAACSADTSALPAARIAHTFRALRTGQLTSASVWLDANAAGANFDMEIWSVDINAAPDAVMAGTTITNAPTRPPAPLQLTGAFAGPASVVAGLRYALVITTDAGQSASFRVGYPNQCPDGSLFTWENGAFVASPNRELRFQTVVVA